MKRIPSFITALVITILTLHGAAFAESGEKELNRAFDNETIQSCVPDNFDLSAAQALGLAEDTGFTTEYFRLQKFYVDAIWAYVDEKCGITQADALLREDNLRFIPSSEPVSIYQQNCSNGLSFFFLRNNVYLERLSPERLAELRALYTAGDPEGAKEFVENTLPELICPYPDGEENLQVVYEVYGLTAPNKSLVFGVTLVPEYGEDGNFVDVDNEVRKLQVLKAYTEKLTEELTEMLEVAVTIFVYG